MNIYLFTANNDNLRVRRPKLCQVVYRIESAPMTDSKSRTKFDDAIEEGGTKYQYKAKIKLAKGQLLQLNDNTTPVVVQENVDVGTTVIMYEFVKLYAWKTFREMYML